METVMLNEITQTLSDAERDKLFEELYITAFPVVARFVRKMNGSLDDASDLFQDALVIYYEKSNDADFTLYTSPEAYILGITKHLWMRKYTHDHKKVSLDMIEASITIPNDYTPEVDSLQLLKLLATTGEKCMELLQAFYYEKISMKLLAGKFGFGTERSATVQKYKCIEKIRNTIKEKSISYEDFIE
jgi:DNA-directed RNA polymerase specialized sigma24 family protein